MKAKRKNAVLEFVRREASALGVQFTTSVTGSGHIRLSWRIAPEKPSRCYVIPSSPGDSTRAPKNAWSDIRRIFRQDMALK